MRHYFKDCGKQIERDEVLAVISKSGTWYVRNDQEYWDAILQCRALGCTWETEVVKFKETW